MECCLKEKDFEKNSREYIKKEFDWDRVVDKTVKLYEEVKK